MGDKEELEKRKRQKSPIARQLRSALQDLQQDGQQHLNIRGIKPATRADYLHNGSFHEAIAPVLVMAQCFCLMPVRGICAKSSKELSFHWLNFRTWCCVLYVLTTVADTILTIRMVMKEKLDVRNLEPFIFHISILMGSIGFLHLASKWPRLMRKWERVERQMPAHVDWRRREELAHKIKVVTFVLTITSLTEHLLSTISVIHFANYCPADKDPIKSYFLSVNSHIFNTFEYSNWLAVLGKVQNVLMTFGWSYMDVFVMNLGIGLSALLKRVQSSMEQTQVKAMPESYWTRTRLQYRVICELIEEVDGAISGIVMLTFANNLYFVCIQLLKSINKMPSVAHTIYFYFSLLFLLARTLAVSLFLAEVNERARFPLQLLKQVPTSAYGVEVERFADEVANDVVAITGLKYFSITRSLVLSVAGTIVTYELVLIQFHEDQKLWNCGND